MSNNDTLATASLIRSRLFLLMAAALWSTSGLFVKSPPLQAIPLEYRGPLLACYRALFAALFLLPFVNWKAVRWRPMLIPMLVSFTAMNVLFVTALTMTTAAAAIFLQYTSTVWAFVFGFLFLKERIDRGNLFALACALAGIVWIVAADWHGEYFLGNLIALGSGVAYAGVIVTLRILRNEDSAWLITLNHATSCVVLLPWVLWLPVSLAPTQWALTGLFGVVQMALPYVFFARGVRLIRTQEAALIILIEPILNPFWVWLLWGEQVNLATWIGGGLILGGLASRYLLFPVRDTTKQSAVSTSSSSVA